MEYKLIEIVRGLHGTKAYIQRANGSIFCDWFFKEHSTEDIVKYIGTNKIDTSNYKVSYSCY